MNEILELPVPRTEAGALQFHVALDAHAHRERWARRRRVATAAAALGHLPWAAGELLGLGPALHHVAVTFWVTSLGVMAVSTVAGLWWGARLERAVAAIGGRAHPC
ncbi:MAG TPA: hypothetical protein VKZ18_03375 [Polyangia bacterium]|nr:hypothetical protein [Polyangia bacterium]